MQHLATYPHQFKKRFIGVGFYHWYSLLTNRFAILPKLTIAHDPDAHAQGRVLSGTGVKQLVPGAFNVWRKLRKPRPSWIVYLE